MAMINKIFIGSSSGALNAARQIKDALKEAGMDARVWDEGVFNPGKTLLETIERIPAEYHGVVLLWSPDVYSERSNRPPSRTPVPNTIFEYGYLAGRLTRERVAICQLGELEPPSDLDGLTMIKFEGYEEDKALPDTSNNNPGYKSLVNWANQLPEVVTGLPSLHQLHGYSGVWRVQNSFSKWRGIHVDVKKGDKIYFDGKTILFLNKEGSAGSGVQVGHLYIMVAHYTATYEILNEVLRADVNNEGTLTLHIKVNRRRCIEEYGDPPSDRYRADLPNTEFKVVLKCKSKESKTLVGTHEYQEARQPFQVAEETFEHIGLFNCFSI